MRPNDISIPAIADHDRLVTSGVAIFKRISKHAGVWLIDSCIFRQYDLIEIGLETCIFYLLVLYLAEAVGENMHPVFWLQVIEQLLCTFNQCCLTSCSLEKIITQPPRIHRIINTERPHRNQETFHNQFFFLDLALPIESPQPVITRHIDIIIILKGLVELPVSVIVIDLFQALPAVEMDIPQCIVQVNKQMLISHICKQSQSDQ